jgi:predicted transcriptional regulator
MLKIEHVMTKDVITVESKSSLKGAVELMNTHDIGCVVVMENGKPVGIITERDLLKKVLVNIEEAKMLKVDQIMSTPIIAAQPEDSVEAAARIILAKRIKKLPVVENGKLVGIVTLTDLFKFEPELIKSYTILMRARTEQNVLDPTVMKTQH